MKRIALLACLLLTWPCAAQDIPLEVKGDTKTVKVDKVIVTKEDLLVVNSLPFSVHAPIGGVLYSWQYPSGVEAIRRGNKLDVSKAPNGRMTIAVEYAVVIFDKVKQEILTDIKTGQVTFSIGAPDPPISPKPPDPPTTEKVTAATYVYEKDQTAIPNQVLSALNRLNRERRIIATVVEADAKDGTGEVPAQYRVALEAAKKAGLPALVVTAGDRVLAVLKDPKTEQEVIDVVGKVVTK